MKRSKTSKQWMREHVNDVYVQRAKSEGYRSRAAYKLLEIAARDKLLKPGMVVVDLGAAPGGWSQVARAQVGARGLVLALDLLEMAPLPGVTFLQGDFREDAVVAALAAALAGRTIDLVLSDMSPNISGIAMSDQARVMHLAELALEFAAKTPETRRQSAGQSVPGLWISRVFAPDADPVQECRHAQAGSFAWPQQRVVFARQRPCRRHRPGWLNTAPTRAG